MVKRKKGLRRPAGRAVSKKPKRKNGFGLPTDFEEKLEQARMAAPKKPSVYRYLRLIRRIACTLDKRPDWKSDLAQLCRSEYPRISNAPERLLVEITCGSDVTSKMKHKYTKVLEAARHYDVPPKELQKRINELGGINESMRYAPRKDARRGK
jgi:hypothetical protein